jgi:hypothetical protein
MRGHQGIAGHLGAHLAIAQDAVGQDGAHGSARGAREPPDGESTQPDTGLMGVACKTPATAPSGLVFELKAEGQEEGDHAFDKGFAIAKQLKVGRFMLKINRDSPVFAGLASGIVHGSSSGQRVGAADDPKWRNTCTIARRSRRAEVPHHEIRWNVRRRTASLRDQP